MKSLIIYLLMFCSFLSAGQDLQESSNRISENYNKTANALDLISLKETNRKDLRGFWKTDFKVHVFTDRSTTNSVLSTEIYGKIDWDLTDSFSFYTQGLIIGRSGFTQSIYDRSDRKNGLYLLEGYFDINILPKIFLRFGSIKQDFLKAPLFITDKTFPSFLQNINIPISKDSKISFIFQQSIPDNATESVKRETQVVRWAPLFLTASAFYDLNSISFLDISLKEKLTSFYFTNLSAAVAESGRIRGNTIDLMGSDSNFKYKFLGVHNSLSLQIPVSEEWIFEMGGDILYNVLAPDTFNQGERLYTSFFHNYKNFIEVKIAGEYFANQSDSSVAYYNSEIYGHNNRVGALLKLQTHFYKSGITLGMTYVYSKPINPKRSSVGVSKSFTVFLGTNYVSI